MYSVSCILFVGGFCSSYGLSAVLALFLQVTGTFDGKEVKGLAFLERAGFQPLTNLSSFFKNVGGAVRDEVQKVFPDSFSEDSVSVVLPNLPLKQQKKKKHKRFCAHKDLCSHCFGFFSFLSRLLLSHLLSSCLLVCCSRLSAICLRLLLPGTCPGTPHCCAHWLRVLHGRRSP